MADETRLGEQDKLLAELLLRISTVEKLLIDKNVITLDEYSNIFNESVTKLVDAMKNMKTVEEVIPPGVLKN
jgi:hypothetical protein